MPPEAAAPWAEASTVDVDLALPPEARFVGLPEHLLAHSRALIAATVAVVPDPLRGVADLAATRLSPALMAEARALAARLDVDWRDIVLANLSYDLTVANLGCSTAVLATDRGPALARNMDWWPEQLLARASCRLRYRDGDETRFLAAGWIGAIGAVTGVSSRGVAVALNAVMAPEPPDPDGAPVLLLLREVLAEADGYEAAVARLRTTPLASSGLFTVAGADNAQRMVIERTPRRAAVRRPMGNAALVTTNDYRTLADADAGPAGGELIRTACGRFDALTERAAAHASGRAADDTLLLAALTDPRVCMQITCQHVLMRPGAGELRVFVPRRLL